MGGLFLLEPPFPPDPSPPMLVSALLVAAGFVVPLPFQPAYQAQEGLAAPQAESPFPASNPVAEEVSPEALERLDALVASFVEEGQIVGGELLVIKNGRTLLHTAHGWRDREAQQPLEPGGLYCVRSMTKSLIGTATRMLIDDRKLKASDPIANYLPCYDVDGLRGITVEMLLRHRGGFPFSLMLGKDLSQIGGIQDVAALARAEVLDFEPGTRFSYSDHSSDTLAAVIEVASGMPVAEFVEKRLLEPLGMTESATLLHLEHPLRAKAVSKYVGSPGAWTRYWKPEDPSLFPCFLGSQGLYATTVDYARFCQFWLDRCRVDRERLLKSMSVKKTLRPSPEQEGIGVPSGFPGLQTDYGDHFQLWTTPPDGEDGEREVRVFGHTGSDGTHAWVFPDQEAIALYFTQSRGSTTGLEVEEVLAEVFLGAPFDPNQAAPPFEDYLGLYWEGPGDLHRAIVRDGDHLALEILGKAVAELRYVGEDRWKIRREPANVLAFHRDESGRVEGFRIGEHQEWRFEPQEEMPSVDQIVERLLEVHGMGSYADHTPLRMEYTLNLEAFELVGKAVSWYDAPNRYRVDVEVGDNQERVVFDGERAVTWSSQKESSLLEGKQARQVALDQLPIRFGDWREHYTHVQVVQRMFLDGRHVLLVRAGEPGEPCTVFGVDEESGRLVREYGQVVLDAAGEMGRRMEFADFRQVGELLIPFKFMELYPSPLIGRVISEGTAFEIGAELPEGGFRTDAQ